MVLSVGKFVVNLGVGKDVIGVVLSMVRKLLILSEGKYVIGVKYGRICYRCYVYFCVVYFRCVFDFYVFKFK